VKGGTNEVVASANVTSIQDKLSREAFSGAKVCLLNSKDILLADMDGTRGIMSLAGTESWGKARGLATKSSGIEKVHGIHIQGH
jgi:hypothetical protein